MTVPWVPEPLPEPWADPWEGDDPWGDDDELDELGPPDDAGFGDCGWPVELAGPEFWMWMDRLVFKEP
jgi:hypothetical protein